MPLLHILTYMWCQLAVLDKQSFKQKPMGVASRSHDFDADEPIVFDISSLLLALVTIE